MRILAVGLLLLAACGRARNPHDLFEFAVAPDHQKLAIAATLGLRDQFNSGRCVPASICQDLMQDLGRWLDFTPYNIERCAEPAPVVCVRGPAVFEKDQVFIEIAWRLDGTAKLEWVAYKRSQSEWVHYPPLRPQRFWDTRPANPRA